MEYWFWIVDLYSGQWLAVESIASSLVHIEISSRLMVVCCGLTCADLAASGVCFCKLRLDSWHSPGSLLCLATASCTFWCAFVSPSFGGGAFIIDSLTCLAHLDNGHQETPRMKRGYQRRHRQSSNQWSQCKTMQHGCHAAFSAGHPVVGPGFLIHAPTHTHARVYYLHRRHDPNMNNR